MHLGKKRPLDNNNHTVRIARRKLDVYTYILLYDSEPQQQQHNDDICIIDAHGRCLSNCKWCARIL